MDIPVQPAPSARCWPGSRDAAFWRALAGGGDSRLVADPATGLNKYLCPVTPAPGLACLASCTASPLSAAGAEAARARHAAIARAANSAAALAEAEAWIAATLATHVGTSADISLFPSGTDGILFAAMLFAIETGGGMTAILPAASETGSGVPMAAACRGFDTATAGRPLLDATVATREIPLRDGAGRPRPDDALTDAFARAIATAPGRVVTVVTLGSKTGLAAPLSLPRGADAIVDACQFRVSPARIRDCLARGWPVVVTGSKFLGGPAFSGAVLLPPGRFAAGTVARARAARAALADPADPRGLGPILRWTAALAHLPASIAETAERIARLARAAEAALALPGIRRVPGPSAAMTAASGFPAGIVTVALADPADPGRDLSHDALRSIHRVLAERGVLVGQPVRIGRFGGLRVAVGARDTDAGFGRALARFVAILATVLPRI